MSILEYWIWFSALRGLRSVTRRALLERFGSAKEIYFAEPAVLRQAVELREEELECLLKRDLHEASRILRRCRELEVRILTIQDAIYPERLRNIPDPPSVLYVLGRLPDVDGEACVAVVGTRKSSVYGDKVARSMGYEITAKGGLVVTGLAGGIDSRAAEGALMAGGPVIGVLGVAINDVYPSWNTRLYEDVRRSGAMISEYPPDSKGSAAWFPMRNRIMAGLSLGTVVIEAPLRSGALITARLANDYGRDVFAVPGNADAPNSRGCNRILREFATVAENGWDVLQEYQRQFPGKLNPKGRGTIPEEYAIPEDTARTERQEPKPSSVKAEEKAPIPSEVQKGKRFWKFRVRTRNPDEDAPKQSPLESQLGQLNENQLKIVGVMSKPGMHIDDIVDLSRLPAAVVLSELTMLQIKGFVTQEPGKRFSLNLSK